MSEGDHMKDLEEKKSSLRASYIEPSANLGKTESKPFA